MELNPDAARREAIIDSDPSLPVSSLDISYDPSAVNGALVDVVKIQKQQLSLLLKRNSQVRKTALKRKKRLKPMKKVAQPVSCRFCKKLGHTQKICRMKLGLCLICGAADHQAKDCMFWTPTPLPSLKQMFQMSKLGS